MVSLHVPFRKLFLATLFICIFLDGVLVDAAELKVVFESNNFTMQRISEYDVITMEGFHALSTPGKPALPAKKYLIGLPPGSSFQSVQITEIDNVELEGTYRIKPAGPILPMGDQVQFRKQVQSLKAERLQNIQTIYSTNEAFPEECVQVNNKGSLGNLPYISVTHIPFSYHPLSGRLVIYRKTEISIQYEYKRQPDSGNLYRVNDAIHDRASHLFYNFDDLETYFCGTMTAPGPDAGLYDYIIITSTPLLNAITASDFIDWKKTLGYNIKTVLISDPEITAQPGRDLPQKIRTFLRNNYLKWGIKYLLIVGDHNTIPMRYTYPDPTDHSHFTGVPNGATGEVPTDYYYADLSYPDNLSWDLDGDGYYGEYGEDNPDLLAEIYVGRVPVDNTARITYTLNKLVTFEKDTGAWKNSALHAGAFWYFDNENYSACDVYDGATCMNEIETNLMPGWTISHYSEQAGLCPSVFPWPALTKTAFCNDWRTGQYSIINWGAHGHTNRAARKIWDWDDGDSVPETAEISWNDYISLTSSLDDDYPSFVFAISCLIGCPEQNTQGRIGVDLLTKPGWGSSIGVVGATRTVYGKKNWPVEKGGGESMCYEFNHYLINGPSGPEPAGEALYNSKFFCYTNYGYAHFAEYWNNFDYNLFGDPSLVREGINPHIPVFCPSGMIFLILLFSVTMVIFSITRYFLT